MYLGDQVGLLLVIGFAVNVDVAVLILGIKYGSRITMSVYPYAAGPIAVACQRHTLN